MKHGKLAGTNRVSESELEAKDDSLSSHGPILDYNRIPDRPVLRHPKQH